MRYEVTELEGFLGESRSSALGVSCMVVDTLWNRRVVGTWRSEDYGGTTAQLNGADVPEVVAPESRFRPSCPKCGDKCHPLDTACSRCGTKLYLSTCRNGHPVTTANSYYRPNGKRECRICRREAWR